MSVDVLAVIDSSLALLRMGEWAVKGGTDVTSWGCCPDCGAVDWEGHKTGCAYAEQIERHEKARAAIAELIAAAGTLTVHSDGRGYFESGQDCQRFRAALAAVTAQGAGSVGGEVSDA